MDQFLNAQLLERAGLAAGLLASIWVNYKLVTSFNKTIQNHVSHSNESQTKLTNAVEKLIKFLELRLKK